MSLKEQAKSGMIWTFLEQFGTQLISFVISIVLARLLVPEDFGIIALFSVVIGIAGTIIEGGLSSSIIRTKDPQEEDFSTVFIFNMGMSIIMYILIFFLAPFIADFYTKPILTPIIRIYAIILVINAFAAIQRTQLTKDLKFKTLFKINLPSLIISGLLGLLLAYLGYGVWALVYSAILKTIVSTLQLWLYSSWRPKLLFNKEKFKYHFSYGSRMTLSGLLNILFINIYTIIIGKQFSLQQLGYYNRADNLKQLPVSNISNALNKVTFPLFAKISHDDIKLREVYQRLMRVVIFIIAPTLTLMVVLAEPIIRLLLTDKWLPTVPYLQILAIAGLLYPIHSYNLNILQVKGRSDLFLRLEIIKKSITVAVLFISIQFGIFGLLWGQVFTSTIAFFINTHYTGKFLKYNSLQQFIDLLPSICLAIVCGSVIYYLNYMYFATFHDIFTLFCLGSIYILIYLLFAYLLKFKEITHIKQLLKK